MKTMKVLAIICSVIFILSLGAGLIFAAAGFDDGLRGLVWSLRDGVGRNVRIETGDETVEGDGLSSLSVRAGAAEVELVREDRETIQAEYTLRYLGHLPDDLLSLRRDGTQAVLTINDAGGVLPFFLWRELLVTLRIPENYRGDLTLDAGAGFVRLPADQIFSRVDLRVGAGGISIGRLTAREVTIDVSAGRLTAAGLSAGRADLTVGAGELRVRDLSGEVDLSVSMGAATLEFARVEKPVTASVDMGGATLLFPEDTRADLRLSANVGTVSQEFGEWFQGESSSSRVNGTLNGGGVSITGNADMGSLRIRPLNA